MTGGLSRRTQAQGSCALGEQGCVGPILCISSSLEFRERPWQLHEHGEQTQLQKGKRASFPVPSRPPVLSFLGHLLQGLSQRSPGLGQWMGEGRALAAGRWHREALRPCFFELSFTGNLASNPCTPKGQGSLGTPCLLSDGVWTEASGSSSWSIKKSQLVTSWVTTLFPPLDFKTWD